MKKVIVALVMMIGIQYQGEAQIGKLLNKVKDDVKSLKGDDNTGLGLKEALNNGVGSAVKQLAATNGFLESTYKVMIPEDAQKVINVVKKVPGFQDVEVKLINQMNLAAEIAVTKATPIFTNAITKMTFADAKAILFGNSDAATKYLDKNSRPALAAEFLPIIQSSLDEVNARSYWKTVVDAYNKIPLQKKMNPDLDAHVNNKALDGLFGLIQVKEAGIRNDIDQRTSPLLKEVFGQVKK